MKDGTNTCCKGCEERHPKCHANCEKYAEFKAKIDKEYKAKIEVMKTYREINKPYVPRSKRGKAR